MPVFNIPRPSRPQSGQSSGNAYNRANNRDRAAEFSAKQGYRQYTQPQKPMKPAVMNSGKRPPVQTTQPINPGPMRQATVFPPIQNTQPIKPNPLGQANIFPPTAPKPDYSRFNVPVGGSLQPISTTPGQGLGSLSEILRSQFAGRFGDQTLPVMPQFGQRI